MKHIKSLLIILCFFSLPSIAQETQTPVIPSGQQGSIIPLLDNKSVLTGKPLLDNTFPNSWQLPNSNIRMLVSGYVKGDFIQDFDYLGDRYEFELGSIAVDGSPEKELGGITTFHAKQTRINFDFRSSAKWVNGREFPLQVFLEVDWFFDEDELRLNTRLRHAYGVIGRILVGRTWTTSADLSAIPGTIDFSAGDAIYGGRLAQIRWQDKINERFSYAIALEDPVGQIDNPLELDGAFRPTYPNFAGMIKWKAKKGSSIQLGADVFPLSWKEPSTGPNINKTGYALTLYSRIILKGNHHQDALVWGGGIGEGQAHRIVSLSWDGKASGVISENNLTIAPAWFAYVGFNHYWSKSLNSNFSTAWAGTELSSIQSEDTIKETGSAHINLIWFPYKLVSTGVEYMWGTRVNNNDVKGTASRLQFMVKFKFN